MAATQTVVHDLQFCKSASQLANEVTTKHCAVLRPRSGVVVLSGYGSNVRVERGHLLIEDGIGSDRYRGRFSRIGHGIERLVVIGSDGIISFSALRWLADQRTCFVMLDRDGRVLATTGPVRPSDVKLRRAQALAHHTGAAFRISRELIDRKLAGQERVARESLRDATAAYGITQFRSELAEVETLDAIRGVEARAAKCYWKAWQPIEAVFPKADMPRVPEHWITLGSRASALTGSPRLAVNPINAILNYLYALLEAECSLAIAALGLDPGMGLLHMDTINRDSLACDLMEVIRPDVDRYVLDGIVRRPLKRSWFFEERNGNCRLTADLASQLAETCQTWARLVAPLAEWIVKEIAKTTKGARLPATRLTQSRKRDARNGKPFSTAAQPLRLQNVCGGCGEPIEHGHAKCGRCAVGDFTRQLKRVAIEGRIVAQTAKAQAKRSKTQLASHASRREWSASIQPSWLTERFYTNKIQPQLASLSSSAIARHLAVSRDYATDIRRGRVPHPRHWLVLAKHVGSLE